MKKFFSSLKALQLWKAGTDEQKETLKNMAISGNIQKISEKTSRFQELSEEDKVTLSELHLVRKLSVKTEKRSGLRDFGNPEANQLFNHLKKMYNEFIVESPEGLALVKLTGRPLGSIYTMTPKTKIPKDAKATEQIPSENPQ